MCHFALNQDLHMVNLDDFKYGGTNLTAFRLLDPDREEVKQVVQDWIFGELRYGRKMEAHEQTIKVINFILTSLIERSSAKKKTSQNISLLINIPQFNTNECL